MRVKIYGNVFLRDLTNKHFKKGEDLHANALNICKCFKTNLFLSIELLQEGWIFFYLRFYKVKIQRVGVSIWVNCTATKLQVNRVFQTNLWPSNPLFVGTSSKIESSV